MGVSKDIAVLSIKSLSGGGGGGGGTKDYTQLSNKPQINGVTLMGDLSADDLGIGSVLTDDLSVTQTVGGITSGTVYEEGTSLEDIFKDLLNPVAYPVFTPPSASLTYSVDTYAEVKSSITAKTGTVVYDAGAIVLNGVKQNDRGGAATGYAIATTGADTEYSDSSESSGVFSVPSLTRSTKGTIKIEGTVSYAQGTQPLDSEGNNYDSPLPAGSVKASKTINFIQAYFYGKSAGSTISDFAGLTKSVTEKGQKSFKFTTNNEYMVFAYDSSYGDLSSILDPNGFETISGWNKSTVVVDGFSYFVYVSADPTTDTNAQFTFKY